MASFDRDKFGQSTSAADELDENSTLDSSWSYWKFKDRYSKANWHCCVHQQNMTSAELSAGVDNLDQNF
jgi:hypothetical protein